jgi:O-acetylhomoserine/O-acetylserine sulfhydrylase-like pyridoxal-dependent enzyme
MGTSNFSTLEFDDLSGGATFAELNRAADVSTRIVNATAATLTATIATHEGKIVTLNRAGGIAVTLPAATGSGARLRFIVGTTFTSAGTIAVVGDDTMTGLALIAQDGGDTSVVFETAADSDTITLNGTTTGGLKGADVELIDIAADLWFVNVRSAATGTEATPFSAAVS